MYHTGQGVVLNKMLSTSVGGVKRRLLFDDGSNISDTNNDNNNGTNMVRKPVLLNKRAQKRYPTSPSPLASESSEVNENEILNQDKIDNKKYRKMVKRNINKFRKEARSIYDPEDPKTYKDPNKLKLIEEEERLLMNYKRKNKAYIDERIDMDIGIDSDNKDDNIDVDISIDDEYMVDNSMNIDVDLHLDDEFVDSDNKNEDKNVDSNTGNNRLEIDLDIDDEYAGKEDHNSNTGELDLEIDLEIDDEYAGKEDHNSNTGGNRLGKIDELDELDVDLQIDNEYASKKDKKGNKNTSNKDNRDDNNIISLISDESNNTSDDDETSKDNLKEQWRSELNWPKSFKRVGLRRLKKLMKKVDLDITKSS